MRAATSATGAASGSPPTALDPREFLARKSFIELNARERAQALLEIGRAHV